MIPWAESILRQHGHTAPVTAEPVVETPFSCVKKLTCGTDVFYLKQTPPPLFIEAAVIRFLRHECGVTAIPDIIAQNAMLHCFLMRPCGTVSLRTLFEKSFDMDLFLSGIAAYKQIQSSTEKHVGKLLDIGVPDWRMSRLPLMYRDMLDDSAFMTRCAMTQDQVGHLQFREPAFAKLCADLDAFQLPDCINHSDLQDNNMLESGAAQKVSIVDWGEVTVGNPLMALTKSLKTVSVRHAFDADTYLAVEHEFFGDYFRSPEDMERAISIIDKLSPIYYIFTLIRLEKLTGQTTPQWNSRINGALISFLAQDL